MHAHDGPRAQRGALDELAHNNERFAASFKDGDAPSAPARRLAIVTCMDARVLPAQMLGLQAGDAHVIRNAGGSAREALRSLVISQRLLGTREVAVIKHTDCGMQKFTNDQLRDQVQSELGADAGAIDFLPFASLEQAVREDVAFLRASPLMDPATVVRGFLYDVASGRIEEVATPA